jgi:hypothetical protein
MSLSDVVPTDALAEQVTQRQQLRDAGLPLRTTVEQDAAEVWRRLQLEAANDELLVLARHRRCVRAGLL